MPTYAYKCQACAHEFEAVQKITDPSLKSCPKCQGQVERLLQPAPFILKGKGWYVSDYVRKGKDKEPAESVKSEPAQSQSAQGKEASGTGTGSKESTAEAMKKAAGS